MSDKHYAGVGARSTPPDMLLLMKRVASYLQDKRWILRSGGAKGADKAFEKGSILNEIIIPEEFIPKEAITMVKELLGDNHWQNLSVYGKRCHARNAMQILGRSMDIPVDMVICWTPNGETVGGTATAIKLADKFDIPVFNLGDPDDLEEVLQMVGKARRKKL
jgi:hypothetical protein